MGSQMTLSFQTDTPWEIEVRVMKEGNKVGFIRALPQMEKQVNHQVRQIAEKEDLSGPFYVVDDVRLDEMYRGQGIGTELYVRAAKEAAKDGGVLVSAQGAGLDSDVVQDTSEDAHMVWERLDSHSDVNVYDFMVAEAR
jgi:GNAT superfamily N-acetyltransferase